MSEYCVAFPDQSRPYGSPRLPDSDDVLAKWIALNADERRLMADANVHLPGRQIDPDAVRRDLARLASFEHEHARTCARELGGQAEKAERQRAATPTGMRISPRERERHRDGRGRQGARRVSSARAST